mgnify:FL=1
MTAETNITRMDAFTYRDLIKDGNVVMLIPVGAIEQHGAHMPLGVDALLSTKMAELTAEKMGGALVGPSIEFGYKSQQRSGGGAHIIGTFGFDADTMIGTVRTLVREFHRHGVHNLVFVNGHYENYQFIYEGVDLALRDLSGEPRIPQVMMMSYWDFVTPQVIETLYPEGFPGWDVEHGGVMETSIMLEFFPDLVHLEKLIDHPAAELPLYDILPAVPQLTPASGCLSSGKASTPEKGRILTDSIVERMSAAIRGVFTA